MNLKAYIISESTIEAHKPEILRQPKKNEMVKIIANLQDIDVWNRNNRKYLGEPLIKGLNAPHITELIKANSFVGEAGHPVNPTMQRQTGIDNNNVSHRINKWWRQGNVIKGEVEAMNGGDNSPGIKFHNFILQDMKVAFSLRAVGPVEETTRGKIVKGPLHIVTYDWVFVPSHKIAYQEDIINSLQENAHKNKVLSEGYMIPVLEEQAISYIKDKSKNLKYISETLGFCYENISLSSDKSEIILKEKNDKLIIKLEDNLKREILSEYMIKFTDFF